MFKLSSPKETPMSNPKKGASMRFAIAAFSRVIALSSLKTS